jgi:hypothetical protein
VSDTTSSQITGIRAARILAKTEHLLDKLSKRCPDPNATPRKEHFLQEYFKLVDLVTECDKRLLTVMGWGVTLSLTAIGLGFQYKQWGFFLLSSASSVAFWLIEASLKSYQMRFYPRMREIEVFCCLTSPECEAKFSTPRIDWSWSGAHQQLLGLAGPEPREPALRGQSMGYKRRYAVPTVALPHFVAFALGFVLTVCSYWNLVPLFR